MMYPSLHLTLPDWVEDVIGDRDRAYPSVEERMQLAIALSQRSVAEGGGPFGAGVFDMNTHQLIAPGMNRVVPTHCSLAHAEIVAIAIAQQRLGRFDLGCELVTSTEPCVQCFGALIWAGIRRVICGASSADAEAIGFDEGPKPINWVETLQQRGIEVVEGVLNTEARTVLQNYQQQGGTIYNADLG